MLLHHLPSRWILEIPLKDAIMANEGCWLIPSRLKKSVISSLVVTPTGFQGGSNLYKTWIYSSGSISSHLLKLLEFHLWRCRIPGIAHTTTILAAWPRLGHSGAFFFVKKNKALGGFFGLRVFRKNGGKKYSTIWIENKHNAFFWIGSWQQNLKTWRWLDIGLCLMRIYVYIYIYMLPPAAKSTIFCGLWRRPEDKCKHKWLFILLTLLVLKGSLLLQEGW